MNFGSINDDNFYYLDVDNNPGNLSEQLDDEDRLKKAGFCR